jgi:hypothetical protein
VRDTEIRGAAPDLFAFVLLPPYNNAGKIPAWDLRQSCVLEASRDVRDVAGVFAVRTAVQTQQNAMLSLR